jgi:hypothetical protein
MRLLNDVCRRNLQTSIKSRSAHIMKEFHLIARVAQALLAVGMTLITAFVIFA